MSDVVTIDETTVALWEYQGRDVVGEWTRDDIDTMVERVNRGATLLDQRRPKWNFKVIPEKLDMSSGVFCIVGQACGEYNEQVGPLFGMDEYDEPAESADHAFMTGPDEFDGEWELMDRVWVYLLQERSQTGAPLTLALPKPEPTNVAMQRLYDAGLIKK